MGFRGAADEEQLSGPPAFRGPHTVERALAGDHIPRDGLADEIVFRADAEIKPRHRKARFHQADTTRAVIPCAHKRGGMGGVSGGEDKIRAGKMIDPGDRRLETGIHPFSHIEPQRVNLRRVPPRHRLGEAERLVLVAGFAVADDEDVQQIAHVWGTWAIRRSLAKRFPLGTRVSKPASP